MITIKSPKCIRELDTSRVSTLRCGSGHCRVAVPTSVKELSEVARYIKGEGLDFAILGRLSNTLVCDGFGGIAIYTVGLRVVEFGKDELYVGSYESLPYLAKLARERLISGFERLSGIPGSVGGAIAMNAGCFGSCISDCLKRVYYYDFGTLSSEVAEKNELSFSYRKSSFSGGTKLIVAACFSSSTGNRYEMDNIKEACLRTRKETQPKQPSLGSVFKRVGESSAGLFIEGVGLKGYRQGDMAISDKHANFIVNLGNGKACDYLSLMRLAEKRVFETYGIRLEREVKVLGEER